MEFELITCLGIIGGSGLYNLNGLKNTKWIKIDTPWGDTSDEILSGELNGIQINFIPRHGRGHYHSPSTIPYKQNIFALKKLGVTEILSVSACGSLREDLKPGDFVLVDQFIDKTYLRDKSFFGQGCVAHVSLAHPTCNRFSKIILDRYSLKLLEFKSNNDILPYVDQMFDLLGKTYDKLQTFVPIQPYQIKYYKERYFRYIHPDFIKCVVDKENNLIAFVITMPSFSKALKKINGKLFPFGFLRILWAQKFVKKVSLYLIGVRPDYQNKAVTAILMNEIQKTFNKYKQLKN